MASDAAKPRLKWERYSWAVHMLRRINAGMAKVIAWETRVLPELPADAVVRLVDAPEGRGLEVVSPGAPPGAASRLAEFFPLGHTQGNGKTENNSMLKSCRILEDRQRKQVCLKPTKQRRPFSMLKRVREHGGDSRTALEALPRNEKTMSCPFIWHIFSCCLLYTSPSPRDRTRSRMPSSA